MVIQEITFLKEMLFLNTFVICTHEKILEDPYQQTHLR